MLDLSPLGLTGYIAEKALEQCSIIVNKNLVPEDKKPAQLTSGVRIGTNTLAQRNFHQKDIRLCAGLIHEVIMNIKPGGDREFTLDPGICRAVREKVKELCVKFPIAKYHFPRAAN
jgi:glycine hydroxymethyltransferase